MFATHAREDRHALFSLKRVLTSEARQRKAHVADMQAFRKHVAIIFGVEDAKLNAGVARELNLADGWGRP